MVILWVVVGPWVRVYSLVPQTLLLRNRVIAYIKLFCHRNFGPGNFGPGDQNFQWKIGPAYQVKNVKTPVYVIIILI